MINRYEKHNFNLIKLCFDFDNEYLDIIFLLFLLL